MLETVLAVLVPILICAALIALNALFVAAEFSIVGAPRAGIERRARDGERWARYVRTLLDDPLLRDRFIATAQLGITLASLGLGMYGEHLLAQWLAGVFEGWGWGQWVAAHTLGSIIAIAVLTYFHIVIGEMVPKSLALSDAEATVLRVAPLMRGVQLVVFPLVLVLNGIGTGVLRLFGLRREGGMEEFRTAEELAYIVQESQAGGLMRHDAADVVQELLEFGDLTAYEVMVPRVHVTGIPLGATRAEVLDLLVEDPHTRYPVYDTTIDSVVGLLHVKDMLRRLGEDDVVTAAAVRPVPFVPETATTEEVLAAMHRTRSQLAVVMDEHGGTAGIVTIEDLFEEVVGEIGESPEDGDAEPADANGRVRLVGTTRIDEAGDALGVVLEHEEVSTISGLVLSLLGQPPDVGDVVTYDGVRFEVTEVEGHGVAEVVAELVPEGAQRDDEG